MRQILYILSELSDTDVEWLIAHGQRERVPAGTVLIQQGIPIDALYILLNGQLVVSITVLREANVRKQLHELAVLGAGDVVGEISYLDSRSPSATVTAVDNVLLLSVPHDALNAKLVSDSAFAARFYRAMAIFMAYRLRDVTALLGYEKGQPVLNEMEMEEDELDLDMLDKVHLAGQRFDRILKRLREME